MPHIVTRLERNNIVSAGIVDGNHIHPIRVNSIPLGNINRDRPRKFWDPVERPAKTISLSAETVLDAISVVNDPRGFSFGLREAKMDPPTWHDTITSIAISYAYGSFVQELDAKLQEARRIYSGDRRTLREIEPQFKAATREMDRQYRARGYSAADLKTIKTNVQNLSTEWHNVATFFDQRISDSPRSERVIRSTIINSATDVLNVSSFKTNFPAVIAPSGAVRVNHLVDESGHQCEEWCYSKTLPGVDFSYTIDLPDIPIPWLHVHDWWHWHSKWLGGYPHVHTHWHTRWISLDITFNFTADMYFEMCASATGASIAIAGSACANVNGEGGCCIVEAVGLAGIRVFGDGAGAQGCEYGFGAALAFSCEVFGYDLVDVNIPIGRITVKGPCVVQCEG